MRRATPGRILAGTDSPNRLGQPRFLSDTRRERAGYQEKSSVTIPVGGLKREQTDVKLLKNEGQRCIPGSCYISIPPSLGELSGLHAGMANVGNGKGCVSGGKPRADAQRPPASGTDEGSVVGRCSPQAVSSWRLGSCCLRRCLTPRPRRLGDEKRRAAADQCLMDVEDTVGPWYCIKFMGWPQLAAG